MKRTFKSLAVLALSALAMVSCQKELLGPATQEGQEVAVSLDLTTPLMGTKSYADGKSVDVVHVHVYQHGTNGELTYIQPNATTPTPSKDVRMTNGEATYNTRLVTGQTYTFVFWAEKSGNGAYTYNPATQTVAVSYANATGNDESRDAFYAVKDVTITGAYSASVTLNRPFAQINFGVTAEDLNAAALAGVTVNGAAVKLTRIANSLNLLDGSVSGSETVSFANANLPSETFSAAGVTYNYVAMDYVLVGKDTKTLSDVTLTLDVTGTTSAATEYTYPNVPLQGNYRTNIVGNLFTSPADIDINVDSGFSTPDNDIVIKNVANIADANASLAAGATSVKIAEVTASEASTTTLTMPATPESISIEIENIESSANLQIVAPESGSNPESVSVNIPSTATVENLTINLPQSHVEVNGASYTSINATTSNNTLVIGSDVTVETLTIKAGAVEIYGRVKNLVKEEGAGEVKVWTVYTVAQLENAVKATKKVVLGKNISALAQIELNNDGAEVEIDLNGYKITKYAAPLKIKNAKVSFTGQGTISASTSHVMQIVGSGTDVADYTVVSIGPDVTISNGNGNTWGILIDKDAAGTYKNYGIVLNIEGSIVTRDNGGAGAITINGTNTNTTGNVPVINLNGANIKFGNIGIYAAGYAKWNFTKTNIEGKNSAMEIRAGEVTINGGNYTATNTQFSAEANGSGTTIIGAAIGVSQHGTDLPTSVTINDGTFNGEYALYEEDLQNETACDRIKLTVNNGTFNGAIYSQNNKDFLKGGTYDDVSALDYMGNYNGDINITMARNGSICTSSFYQNRGGANTSTITIDGAGHKLTFHSEYRNHIQTTNGAKIILKNATVDSDYKVEGSTWDDYGLIFQCPTEFENVTFNRQLALEQPYAHKLSNVTINQTSETVDDMYALWIEAGADVTFNGGAITALSPNGHKNRAIKIADQYITDPQLTKLNVSGVTFKSDKKAAVLVTSTAGADIIWGDGNDISNVAADKENAVWNDSARTAAWDLVTVTGCTKFQEQD